jgi:hypothetical protein
MMTIFADPFERFEHDDRVPPNHHHSNPFSRAPSFLLYRVV